MPSNFRSGILDCNLRAWRGRLRLASALVMLTFVVCHLTAHCFLLVSFEDAETARKILMYPWRNAFGMGLLITAFLIHYSNALWSIYIRRSLRLSRWEWTQLSLGLCIPVLLTFHVVATRIAESVLDVRHLLHHRLHRAVADFPLARRRAGARRDHWSGPMPASASIIGCAPSAGIRSGGSCFSRFGLLLPTLALAGFITGGNQVLRQARDPDFVKILAGRRQSDRSDGRGEINRMADIGWGICLGLMVLPFAGRGIRNWYYRRRRPPMLAHANGRHVPILPGATVLETLRANGIAHASVCGGQGALHHMPNFGDQGPRSTCRSLGSGG